MWWWWWWKSCPIVIVVHNGGDDGDGGRVKKRKRKKTHHHHCNHNHVWMSCFNNELLLATCESLWSLINVENLTMWSIHCCCHQQRWPPLPKSGPDDMSEVVWALSTCFFPYMFFLILINVLTIYLLDSNVDIWDRKTKGGRWQRYRASFGG